MAPSAEELKEFRRDLRVTQVEMAAKLGIARTTYASYEDGTAIFRSSLLPKLAALGWTGQSPQGPVIEAILAGRGIQVATRPSVFAGDPEREEAFDEGMYPSEVPALFFTHDPFLRSEYAAMVVSGESMRRRLMPDDLLVVRKAPSVPENSLVVAKAPDERVYVKASRFDRQRERPVLDSVNRKYPVLDDLKDWIVLGGVIGVWRRSVVGEANVEYLDGRWLRA